MQVTGSGKIIRLLPDDNHGSKHQKFILELDSGQTVLISHNTDLSPPIADLALGDTVEFHGAYRWNEKGGLVHWLHKDPVGQHEAGWLTHNGTRYE